MPHRFPQEAGLRDARRVILRPFRQDDVEPLFAFFQRLPQDTKRFAWDRIDQKETVVRWSSDMDFDKACPLLAWDNGRVVADATLHYRDCGPLRLVGRVKWLLDPDFRGVGLGTILINLFISMAQENGLRHLTCMLIRDLEEDAIKTLKSLGFEAYELPGYGTDPDGNQKDMVKMVLKL